MDKTISKEHSWSGRKQTRHRRSCTKHCQQPSIFWISSISTHQTSYTPVTHPTGFFAEVFGLSTSEDGGTPSPTLSFSACSVEESPCGWLSWPTVPPAAVPLSSASTLLARMWASETITSSHSVSCICPPAGTAFSSWLTASELSRADFEVLSQTAAGSASTDCWPLLVAGVFREVPEFGSDLTFGCFSWKQEDEHLSEV